MSLVSRREFLLGAAGAAAAAVSPRIASASTHRLTPAPGEAGLVTPDGPPTRAWLYNNQAPGPVIRARQGETLRVDVENGLEEPTTVHWHGMRIPVEMDGAPYISQPPIKPGESFTYEFELKDAGTFWYHPHINSSEQVGRGLHGLLIIDEPPEIAARLQTDRDIAWALDDWRLNRAAQIEPFSQTHDMSHGGRFGNVLTVNGAYLTRTELRSGERLRLRICNVANAQSFHLRFAPFDPWVIALDGHPVPPRRLGEEGLWIGGGQRVDLILDVDLEPGATAKVIDDAYGADRAFEVMTWNVSNEARLRERPLGAPEMLPPNPVATPDLDRAMSHSLVFEGGARGGMRGAILGGAEVGIRELIDARRFWAINGVASQKVHEEPPLLTFKQGETQIITLENRTRWRHPIHLHGMSFHVLTDRADPFAGAVIRDTVLMQPDDKIRIALVADNPGKWMLHCHVLEHQQSGMMGVVEVA